MKLVGDRRSAQRRPRRRNAYQVIAEGSAPSRRRRRDALPSPMHAGRGARARLHRAARARGGEGRDRARPRARGRGHRPARRGRSPPAGAVLAEGSHGQARLRAVHHDAPASSTARSSPAATRLDAHAARAGPRDAGRVARDERRGRRARHAACTTTRARVEPGDLFVARAGARADGASFVADAVGARRRGRAGERGRDVDARGAARASMADDVPRALAFAAAAVYGHPTFALEVVGITGTNGKTTTAHLVRAADRRVPAGAPASSARSATASRDLDLPRRRTRPPRPTSSRASPAAMRARGATHVAMEVSSIALAAKRVDAVRFRVAALHEPDAGPPRLPRHDGGVRRREGAALLRSRARRRP